MDSKSYIIKILFIEILSQQIYYLTRGMLKLVILDLQKLWISTTWISLHSWQGKYWLILFIMASMFSRNKFISAYHRIFRGGKNPILIFEEFYFLIKKLNLELELLYIWHLKLWKTRHFHLNVMYGALESYFMRWFMVDYHMLGRILMIYWITKKKIKIS